MGIDKNYFIHVYPHIIHLTNTITIVLRLNHHNVIVDKFDQLLLFLLARFPENDFKSTINLESSIIICRIQVC